MELPPQPEVVAPSSAEPTLPQHTVEPTRTSVVHGTHRADQLP